MLRFSKVSTLFFVVSFCLSQAWASVESVISGNVVDSEDVAVSGAEVQLQDKSGKVLSITQTSETGTYSFPAVLIGDYQVVIFAKGISPLTSEIHVSSGGTTQADFHLVSDSKKEMVMEVKTKRRLIQNSSSVSRSEVNQEQIRQLPQGSEISLPKLISTTSPGVVPGSFGQMFIRGNHANIQYQIDGVQLPESPSNTFGQAFSPRNIDSMELITGGFPAEYGLRLSGVVNIATKSGTEKPGGEIELNYGSYNTTSPHLLYGGSNESGSLHYFVSANYYRTDRGIDTPQPESVSNQTQGGSESIHNTATGNSEFVKVDWQADNSNKFSFSLFNSYLTYQIPNYPSSFSPNSPFFSQTEYEDAFGNHEHGSTTFLYRPAGTDNTQTELNAFAQVVWKHTYSEKSFFQLAPYYKYSQIIVTRDRPNDLFTAPGGAFPIANSTPTSFDMNRHVNNLGLKGDYTWRLNDSHLFKTGFQIQGAQASGSFSLDFVDNTTNPGNPFVRTVSNSSPTTGYFESVYIQDDFTIFKPLTLNLGLRYDATQFVFADLKPSDGLLQPRIGLNYLITDTTKFHAFYGKLFQPSAVENLRTTFNQVNYNPAPYDIKAEKDDYFELGVAQQFLGSQVAQVNVYYKDAENMLDDAQMLNTVISQPYNYAKGYAYGVELSVKGKITEDWSEYFNYSYNIAQGKGLSGGAWASDEPASPNYQMLDHIQTHTANAGLTYSKNHFWWTGQGLFGSGLRTGHEKEISLPAHLTFDTTVGYQFHGKSWLTQFRVSADVLNIFDNRYPITIANGFNGSHYAAGRQFFIRFAKDI